ncbi:hypothetical protein Zmor_014595 [Zophobas morio]|uniref:Uncharacterized protein n=1 Tax=Zophobas morio TaxID=2755281 RepID=A0AA38MGZ3_9CUCU|nr:hypothetical protein Zmor_014595 [Zophobas morio]
MVAIQKIYDELKSIRTYLIKIGSDRRNKGECLVRKVEEAKIVYLQLQTVITHFDKDLNLYTEEEVEQFKKSVAAVNKVYHEILSFVKEKSTDFLKMAFDLKVACNLLPIMNGKEDVTLQLLDAIELYDTMLDTNNKTNLINFVLKTRLSPSAKIRLNRTYNSVQALVTDMKIHLLTRKSDTALQTKLMRTIQGNKSIEDFGKEIEDLFVNLTISQANGDDDNFKVLKPVNERIAIKQFSDGLRDSKLSTIINSSKFYQFKRLY